MKFQSYNNNNIYISNQLLQYVSVLLLDLADQEDHYYQSYLELVIK